MDWGDLKSLNNLNPTTPEEWLEAIRRFVEKGMEGWDTMPDGDGVNESPEDAGVVTKTDLFRVINGCGLYALDLLKLRHDIG